MLLTLRALAVEGAAIIAVEGGIEQKALGQIRVSNEKPAIAH